MTTKQKAIKLYKKVNTFIISCVGDEGFPLTKAVVPPKYRDSLKEIYFCTNTTSRFVSEIKTNPKSSVYFYKRGLFIWEGCYMTGTMELVIDKSIKEKYWQNKYKGAYSEKGIDCPDYCVLRFFPKKGRYYSWYNLEDFEI